jgi:hypothetical protein
MTPGRILRWSGRAGRAQARASAHPTTIEGLCFSWGSRFSPPEVRASRECLSKKCTQRAS